MSGSFISTGVMTNDGAKQLDINLYLSKRIKGLSIHVIPLSTSGKFANFQAAGAVIKMFLPMVFNPSLTHIAIQLFLEDSEDALIIEYGQYLTKDSNLKNNVIFSGSSNSSNEPRPNKNENYYYYINKDGVRITIFTINKLREKYIHAKKCSSGIISYLIASQYYNITVEECIHLGPDRGLFHVIDCDIRNEMTLKDLIDKIKGEKWEAEKYSVLFHNCQMFGAEVIRLLEAVRINEEDKIRAYEKGLLPGCISNALWHNEDFSLFNTNSLGRIPIFGLFHDLYIQAKKFNER